MLQIQIFVALKLNVCIHSEFSYESSPLKKKKKIKKREKALIDFLSQKDMYETFSFG